MPRVPATPVRLFTTEVPWDGGREVTSLDRLSRTRSENEMGLFLVENTLRVGYLSLLLSLALMTLLTMRASFRHNRVIEPRRRGAKKEDT